MYIAILLVYYLLLYANRSLTNTYCFGQHIQDAVARVPQMAVPQTMLTLNYLNGSYLMEKMQVMRPVGESNQQSYQYRYAYLFIVLVSIAVCQK